LIKHIRKSSIAFALVSSLALFSGCGIDNTDENTVSGEKEFVKGIELVDLNDSYMLGVLRANDLNKTNPFGYENAFGYKSVIIHYNTEDENGEDVVASGLLVIPTISERYKNSLASIGKDYSVSMICDNHRTIFTDAEAPSNVAQSTLYPQSVSMVGLAGFAGIYPDYLGYGVSNKKTYHPYLMKDVSAESSLDMIKASIYYMEQNGILLNYQLYVSGYSQGAHVAMALAEEIEDDFDTVNLKGVAAMAGPYFVSSFGDATLKSDANMSVPAFMAYVSDSYSAAYEDVALKGMVVEEKVATFDGLFNGDNNMTVIQTNLGLPMGAPSTMLFDSNFIADYESSGVNHPLSQRFLENNVGSFTAQTKMNIIHCDNDDVVPVLMAYGVTQLLESQNSLDVNQSIISGVTAGLPYGSVHGNCAIPAYEKTLGWFDDIRQGKI